MTSPAGATEVPNSSRMSSAGPLVVPLSISIVRVTPPVELISMRWTAPLP